MSYGNRLYNIRKELGLTLEKFGEPLGVTKTTISRIEKEERSMTDQMLKSICRTYNVNEEWLKTGNGDMFIKLTRNQTITDFAADLIKEEESFKARLIEALAKLSEQEWEVLEKVANDLADKKD